MPTIREMGRHIYIQLAPIRLSDTRSICSRCVCGTAQTRGAGEDCPQRREWTASAVRKRGGRRFASGRRCQESRLCTQMSLADAGTRTPCGQSWGTAKAKHQGQAPLRSPRRRRLLRAPRPLYVLFKPPRGYSPTHHAAIYSQPNCHP